MFGVARAAIREPVFAGLAEGLADGGAWGGAQGEGVAAFEGEEGAGNRVQAGA
jgi:hypothetical protein